MSKLIFKGVVKNNLDPKGLGRIIIEPEDWTISDEKYINDYLKKNTQSDWGQPTNPFIFRPLLPNHINLVPQVGELVNIIYTDSGAPFIDGYYIPNSIPDRGFSYTNSAEHMASQSRQGLNYKKSKDLIKDTGEYVKKKYDGAIPKNTDIGISGRLNSDVIWTDNAVILRAGKIDEKISLKQREPIRDENPALLQVSKYDFTTEKIADKDEDVIEKRISHTEVLIEYSVGDIQDTNNYVGIISVYKLAKIDGITETIYFNHLTEIPSDKKELLFSKEITSNTIDDFSFSIRHSIKQFLVKGVGGISDLDFFIKHPSNTNPSKNTPIYPVYFRPVISEFESLNTNSNYDIILNNIHIRTRKGFGLLFDKDVEDTPEKTVKIKKFKINKLEKPSKNIIVLSDTNYLLAYNNNIPTESKGIDFSKVSNYEISQDELTNIILPETYALVRGEKLQELLDVIYLFLISHTHNPAEPAAVLPSIKQELEDKFQDFKQNILSQKLRIN